MDRARVGCQVNAQLGDRGEFNVVKPHHTGRAGVDLEVDFRGEPAAVHGVAELHRGPLVSDQGWRGVAVGKVGSDQDAGTGLSAGEEGEGVPAGLEGEPGEGARTGGGVPGFSAEGPPPGVTLLRALNGPLSLREGSDPAWIEAAEQAYRADEAAARQQQAIPLADGEDYGDEFADEEVPF